MVQPNRKCIRDMSQHDELGPFYFLPSPNIFIFVYPYMIILNTDASGSKLGNCNHIKIHKQETQEKISFPSLKSIDIYWHLQHQQTKAKKNPKCIQAWAKQYSNINNETMKWVYQNPFKHCTETKLLTMQYEIIHRVFPCNKLLEICRVLNSPNCLMCQIEDNSRTLFCELLQLEKFLDIL